MARDRYDVAIVGGGINGCVAAKFLADDHDVVVIERDQIAGDTTAKASGLVSVVDDYLGHLGAARYAVDFFEAYDGTGDFDYTERSTVRLVPPGHEATAREEAALMAERFDVDYLDDPADVEDRFPDTFVLDGFVGAVDVKEGGWVDPYTLAVTYKDDAEASGATIETGVTVDSIATDAGAVTGVETDAGRVEADRVVVAAGWRTRDLVAEFVEVPVRPFRYQTINLEVEREFHDDFPVAWDPESWLYWRPEHNGDLHVGGGTYYSQQPPNVRETVTEGFRDLVAAAIPDRVPGIGDARVVSSDTCRTGDSASPDALPIHDAPDEAPDGLVISSGMHGFGIMGSPVTGAAVRAVVTGEEAPFDMAPFALDRFDDRSASFTNDMIATSPDDVGP